MFLVTSFCTFPCIWSKIFLLQPIFWDSGNLSKFERFWCIRITREIFFLSVHNLKFWECLWNCKIRTTQLLGFPQNDYVLKLRDPQGYCLMPHKIYVYVTFLPAVHPRSSCCKPIFWDFGQGIDVKEHHFFYSENQERCFNLHSIYLSFTPPPGILLPSQILPESLILGLLGRPSKLRLPSSAL